MWWPVVFWVLLVPLLIVLGITYASTRKLYRLSHLLSLFTYIVLIAYVIDVFRLNKDWILGLLFLSTILIIGAGVYVSRQQPKKKKNRMGSWPLWAIMAIMIILLVMGLFGRAALERSVQTHPLPEETSDEQLKALTITYTNNYWLPVGLPKTEAQICVEGQEPYRYWLENSYQESTELMPGATKEITYRFNPGPMKLPEQNATTLPKGMFIAIGEMDVSCERYDERFQLN